MHLKLDFYLYFREWTILNSKHFKPLIKVIGTTDKWSCWYVGSFYCMVKHGRSNNCFRQDWRSVRRPLKSYGWQTSYYNLDLSFCLSVCLFIIYSVVCESIATKLGRITDVSVGFGPIVSDRQGRSRMSWPSYYKMTISLYAWESGRKPHWQGASKGK